MIIVSRILFSSRNKGTKVPITTVSEFLEDSTTCNGVLQFCSLTKLPLPRYTRCKSTCFNISSCVTSMTFKLVQTVPPLRSTITCLSMSRHNPISANTSSLQPSCILSSQLTNDRPLRLMYVAANELKYCLCSQTNR